jgi:hypothetical protein
MGFASLASSGQAAAFKAGIVVYGGTSAGVAAAVQSSQMGKSVLIVGPDKHLGGLSSGGLGFTDTGDRSVIGGLAREFNHRIWRRYDRPEAWRWQDRSEYRNKGQGTPAVDGAQRTMWIFEPHVAEQVFEDLVREDRITVYRDEWLDRALGIKKNGRRIESITTESGNVYIGKMFIDATNEGDLLAAGGASIITSAEKPTGCTASNTTTCRLESCIIGTISASSNSPSARTLNQAIRIVACSRASAPTRRELSAKGTVGCRPTAFGFA